MKVGVVREIKQQEYRVAMTPAGARELVERGHEVLVERGAGEGSAFPDGEYVANGASVLPCDDVWAQADMVVKVKEPLPEEWGRIRSGQVLFTYLHLAPARELTEALVASGATCIAYETVQTADGRLPLLAPMSEVAGRLAPQVGANALLKPFGGRGALVPGLPGVPPSKVVVLGGGIVGANAALIAIGMQADVWVLERSVERMRELSFMLDGRITLQISNRTTIDEAIADADMVIGAVLVTGARAPHLVTRDMLGHMRPGAVLVDVAIDQGGCFETSTPTTHAAPTYEVDGIVHYCVANMPGAVPVTSTKGLTNVTLPYIELIAEHGVDGALRRSPALRPGVNVMRGKVVNAPVADSHGLAYTHLEDLVDGLAG